MSRKIIFFLPNLNSGGAQRVTINLLKALDKNNIEVGLVVANFNGSLVKEIKTLNSSIRIINLDCSRAFTSIIKLAKYIRKEDPKVLISVMNYTNIVAMIAKYLSFKGIPIVFTEHSTFSSQLNNKKFKTKIIKFLSKIFYSKADKIICVSDGVKEDLKKYLNLKENKVKTIYNPIVSSELYSKATKQITEPWIINKDKPLLISVGRLSKEKDLTTLIRAFYYVIKEIDCNLIILGEGPEELTLKKMVNKLNLEKQVIFKGFTNNPYPYIKNSDVFILSSIREGLPTVLVEALALKTPIVSTNCKYGPSEILCNGKLGALVEVNDYMKLSKAILSTLKNEKIKIMDEDIKKYTYDTVCKQYIEMINSLTK